MKRKIMIMLVSLCIAVFAFVPILSVKKDTKAAEWMKQIADDTRIKEMSIPGTHDSGALYSIADVAGKCQDLTIEEQLHIGVRFLDIRLKLQDDEFVVVHGFVDQKLTFAEVLNDIQQFMEKHPSETIFMSIKKEDETVNSSISFEEALERDLKGYEHLFMCDSKIPETLGEMRGKAYIISRYPGETIGIPAHENWKDSTTFVLGELYVQDNYCVLDTDAKIKDIQKTFEYSASNKERLVLNFASCYLDKAFPPSYAGTAAKDVNGWLKEHLDEQQGALGVVICDFITSELAEAIYERN